MDNDEQRDYDEERYNAGLLRDQDEESTSRTYVVGLPVIVTVHDDGTVEYTVDTSEAGEAIREDVSETDDREALAQAQRDAAMAEADHGRRHPETLDTASSASRQHYIDTGRYLTHAQVAAYSIDLDAHTTDDERFGAQED